MNTAPVITIPNGSRTCFDVIMLLINKLTTNNSVRTNCKKLIFLMLDNFFIILYPPINKFLWTGLGIL